MKKFSLLLASAMLATVSAFAQTKPAAPAYTSFDAAYADQDNAYYLYNVEAGLFLCAGNNWGTRASLATNGKKGQNDLATYEDLTLGKAEVAGIPWFVGEATLTNDTECYTFENKSGNGGVYNVVDNLDGIWVDGGADRPYNRWFVNKLDGNTFQLSYFVEQTEGEGDEAVTSIVKPAGWYGAQRLADGDTRTYIEEGANTTWAFVSKAEFDKVQPLLNLYYVQVGLADLISKAKAQGSTADFTAYEALVNDANADRAEVIKVIDVLAPAILLGEAIKAAKEVDPAHDYSKFEALYNSTEATAAELNDATTLLKAITSLKKAIDAALAQYPSLDLSEPKAVYDNLDATLAEVQEAEAKVAEIVSIYEQSQATLDKPADITATIPYVADLNAISAGNGVLPKAGWTSTKQSGNFHINTWSTEGNSDGTNMVTPFLEYWKAGGNNLDDQIFYRDPVKDPFTVLAGAYRISSNIRLYNESGADYMTGVYLFANANRTNLLNPEVEGSGNEIDGAAYGNFNGMLWYWKDSFETYAIVPEGGTLKFGVQTEGANFNWVATRDWKVEYLGDAYDALDHVRKNSELLVPEIGEEAIVTKKLLTDFNAAKDAYANSTSAESILAAYGTLLPLAEDLPANIAAWKAYDDAVYAAREHSILSSGKAGQYIDLLEEYVGNDKIAPSEDYPHGSYMYIIEALELSTEEVEAETAFLAQLLDDAIKKSMTPGEDVSDMLKNPKFNDGFTGWTNKSSGENPGAVYKSNNGASNCVETYNAVIDVYQTVTDVPDGIYSITCQAFERPAMPGNFDGTETSKVFLYMNDFQTNIMNITTDALDPEKTTPVSGVSGQVTEGANCFLDANNPSNTDWPYDSDFEGKYIPNSLEGASYAFQGGRYTQKVYGLVEGGTMKIGLTSNGTQAHWALWSNFTLTYEGKTAEALNELLDTYVERAEDYLEENGDNMTDPASDALDDAIAAAVDSQEGEDADEMWNALVALNKAMADAQENVAAVAKLQIALEAMEEAMNEAEAPSQAALDAYDEVNDVDYSEMITAEVEKFIEQVNLAAAMLRIPAYETASDENPVNMTSVIKNADFELNANNGDWTWNKYDTQNGPNLDNGINGKSCEFWAPSADKLQFEIYQVLTALPAGTYELSAKAGNGLNGQADTGAEGRAALYATTSGGATSSTPIEVTEGEATAAKTYSIIFTLKEGETVEVGFKTVGTMAARWFAGDDFELWYFGAESAKVADGDDALVVIEGIDAEETTISAIYTVTGAKVSSLQKGINIVKYANGKVAKVLVK